MQPHNSTSTVQLVDPCINARPQEYRGKEVRPEDTLQSLGCDHPGALREIRAQPRREEERKLRSSHEGAGGWWWGMMVKNGKKKWWLTSPRTQAIQWLRIVQSGGNLLVIDG